jgi:DNA polymerase-3 subunit delta
VSASPTPPAPPAVLVRGDDPGLVADAAHQAGRDLVGDRDPAMVVEEHGAGGDDLDVGAVLDALTTPPMLVDRRVVIVRDAGRLVAADAARLAAWVAAPVAGVHLLLVGGGGTVPAALVKAVQKAGTVVDTAVGTGAARNKWVAEHLRQAPVRLDERARALLESHLGDDMGRLRGIVDTLAAAYGPGAMVDADQLAPFLGERGAVAPWLLTDAVDAGRTGEALAVLARLLGPGDMHPLAVLTILHRHYQTMLRLDGAPVATAEDAAALVGARSAYPVKKAMDQGRRLGSDKVAEAMCLLADADLDLRGASALPDDAVLQVLVGRLSRLGPTRRDRSATRR